MGQLDRLALLLGKRNEGAAHGLGGERPGRLAIAIGAIRSGEGILDPDGGRLAGVLPHEIDGAVADDAKQLAAHRTAGGVVRRGAPPGRDEGVLNDILAPSRCRSRQSMRFGPGQRRRAEQAPPARSLFSSRPRRYRMRVFPRALNVIARPSTTIAAALITGRIRSAPSGAVAGKRAKSLPA
jgi:hypothetical protein